MCGGVEPLESRLIIISQAISDGDLCWEKANLAYWSCESLVHAVLRSSYLLWGGSLFGEVEHDVTLVTQQFELFLWRMLPDCRICWKFGLH